VVDTSQSHRPEEQNLINRIREALPILADISRADILLYYWDGGDKAQVAAQAQPHSVPSIRTQSLVGQTVTATEHPVVFRALLRGRYILGARGIIAEGAPIVQEVHPIRTPEGKIIGAISIEKTLIEHERHQRRSRVFQHAVFDMQCTVLRGQLEGTSHLSPFGEHDGILVIDTDRRIQYASGIANIIYRKLGYMETLTQKRLADLETGDEFFVSKALSQGICLEEEAREGPLIWIRKAIPLQGRRHPRTAWPRILDRPVGERGLVGVLLTISDVTEARQQEAQLKIKTVMLQEIQHRVKNSLQTIVALLRLQARRASNEEAREIIEESINRILSVALVHDFLVHPDTRVVNIRALADRILNQTVRGVMDPRKRIRLDIQGQDVYLPAEQATPCALVINELIQNSLEHGYDRRGSGTITLNLTSTDTEIILEIRDDGQGLPAGFDLNQNSSLGLKIVQSLVEDGLNGRFELRSEDGVAAIVTFPKPMADTLTWGLNLNSSH